MPSFPRFGVSYLRCILCGCVPKIVEGVPICLTHGYVLVVHVSDVPAVVKSQAEGDVAEASHRLIDEREAVQPSLLLL